MSGNGMRWWARAAIATALVASVITVAGCTEGKSSTNNSGSPQAEMGGTLSVAAAADAQPQFVMANRSGNWAWRKLVFESLVELNDKSEPQPQVATSWKYNEERTELTIQLRDDVKFHSGRAMTADDVVFSLLEVQKPENASQLVKVAAVMTSVVAASETEVVVSLSAPSDSIFDLLDLTPIVDKESWSGIADGEKVIGTGPFTWEKWVPGGSISLKKFADYRDADKTALDQVDISIISDSTALQTALKSDTVQLALGMAQSDIALLKDDPAYTKLEAGGVFYPLGVDVTLAPFDKLEARQALGYAIDRERISQQIFGGDSTITDLWWSPGAPGYPDKLATHYSYDPVKARELLTKAGAAGAEVTITFANMPIMKNLFEIIQNNLSEVGLKVTAEALDVTEYDQRQVAGQLGQSFLLLHGMVGFSPGTIIDAMPAIRAGNPSHFEDAEYTRLGQQLKESSDDTRDTALAELSTYMLDQGFNHIVAVAPQYHMASSKVTGLRVVSLGSIVANTAALTK